jgi:hypothetical protein
MACWISNQHQKHKSGRGPSSEHFWQVWLISVQRFQRRRFKCEKLTDRRTDGRRMLTHDKSSHGLCRLHLCQIMSFSSFISVCDRVHLYQVMSFSSCCISVCDRVHLYQIMSFKCEKLTDRRTDGRRMLTHDKSSHGLWPGELTRGETHYLVQVYSVTY